MNSDYDKQKLFELIKGGKFNNNNCFEWSNLCDKDGYGICCYSKSSKRKNWRVHRLIYHLLIGEIPKGKIICHACDNPKCFNINHIFLGSFKDNALDRDKKGRAANLKGEQIGNHKLNECDVLLIRKLSSQGVLAGQLAKIFKVTTNHICRIVSKGRWNHI